MFNKKKIKKLEYKLDNLNDKIENLIEIVAICNKCGAVFIKNRMKKVIIYYYDDFYGEHKSVEKFYCKKHFPKYDFKKISCNSKKINYYIKNIKVNKEGKICK